MFEKFCTDPHQPVKFSVQYHLQPLGPIIFQKLLLSLKIENQTQLIPQNKLNVG